MPDYSRADDITIAGFGFPTAQGVLGNGAPDEASKVIATCGWHGQEFDPRVGSFALVRLNSPLADRVGERIKVTAEFGGVTTVVYAYVYREADIVEDISLTRGLFAKIAPLSTDEITAKIETMTSVVVTTNTVVVPPAHTFDTDALHYIIADPSEDSPPSLLESVAGNLQLRYRTMSDLGEIEDGPYRLLLNALGGPAPSPPYFLAFDPTHIQSVTESGAGTGTSTIETFPYISGDYEALQLHSTDTSGHYLQWDDRFARTDKKQWYVQMGWEHSLGFVDTDLIAFAAMNPATLERLQVRLFNDSGAGTINLFLERVAVGGAVTVLGTVSFATTGYYGQGIYFAKRNKKVTVGIGPAGGTTLHVVLSDADATRFETGQFGWGWNGSLGTDDTQNWVLDFYKVTDIYREHFEYTYGQVFTPSLDTLVGPDIMVYEKFTLDDEYQPGTVNYADMRYPPQVGLLAKWRDARTGNGVVALSAPAVINSTSVPDPLDIGDTTGFPSAGTVIIYEPYPSERIITVDYTGKTGTTLTGTSLNADVPQDDPAAPWVTGTTIRPLADVTQIGGIFTFIDLQQSGIGIVTDWLGSTWNNFLDPDELFLEVGVSRDWTTLAEDWHYDGNPFTPQPDMVVTDPSRMPPAYFQGVNAALVFEGDPATLYDSAGHPYESGQFAVYATWEGKTGGTLTTVRSKAYNGPPSGTGLAHIFPAGSKVALEQWNMPLIDGVSVNGAHGYGNNSVVYFDAEYSLTLNAPYVGYVGALQALTPYWIVLRVIGNEVMWEFWDSDPLVSGNTYKIRERIVIHDADRIARFGAAVSGGVGPMGNSAMLPRATILDWGYGVP